MWFGARRINGEWRWFGKTTGPVTAVIWEDTEPGFHANENCMGSWRGGVSNLTGKTHDAFCTDNIHFICELVL